MFSSLRPKVFRNGLAVGEDGDILKHGLAPVPKARRLHGDGLQRATQLVHHEGGQRLALNVLGDDQQGTTQFGDLLQQREEVLH